jgi:hypothetical protein
MPYVDTKARQDGPKPAQPAPTPTTDDEDVDGGTTEDELEKKRSRLKELQARKLSDQERAELSSLEIDLAGV